MIIANPIQERWPDRRRTGWTALPGMAAMALAVLACGSVCLAGDCPPRYSVQIIAGQQCGLGQAAVFVNGLNSSGTVVGSWSCPGASYDRAFTWNAASGMTTLPLPQGVLGMKGLGITDAGTIAGDHEPNIPGFGTLGFVYSNGVLSSLGTLAGGTSSEVGAINSSNVVVGSWGNTGSGPFPLAFRWQNGVMQDISHELLGYTYSRALDISDSGIITGWMGDLAIYPWDYHAFIWQNGNVTDLGLPFPKAFASEGHGINSKSQICGDWWRPSSSYPGFESGGFLYEGGRMVDLPVLPCCPRAHARGLNNAGQIVGDVGPLSGPGGGACVWENGRLYVLNDLIHPDAHVRVSGGMAINDAGQIAAQGITWNPPLPTHTVGFLLTPLPPRMGDVDCDGTVNVNDLLEVIEEWATAGGRADLNHDGIVNAWDLVIVLVNWG